jgi:hypothetical protein
LENHTDQKPRRIDGSYISHELTHLFHLEKGYFYTLKKMLLDPGGTVRTFLFDDRSKIVKPIVFVIFNSFIFTIIKSIFHINFIWFSANSNRRYKDLSSLEPLQKWVNINIGYTNLLIGLVVAVFIHLFYRKQKYSFYEILVLLCYILGQAILIFGIFLLLADIFETAAIGIVAIVAYFGYIIWAIGHCFGARDWVNYVKSFFSYFLGMIGFQYIIIAIAYVIKMIG